MADKTVRVVLQAITAGYQSAMAQAAASTKAFGASALTAGKSMSVTGKKMMMVGRSATMFLTLPIVAAGTAAFKMSNDFDAAMKKIVGLVGVAGSEVEAWKDDILSLSSETGIAALDLADAMFFITSAGARGADALDILDASAKAAASGLGETKTVADAVTSAVNAYGIDVLSAAEATDILTGAVRLGKLEADQLAPSIGKVIPIASNMGVTFDEVAAALAGMSKTGTNAATAATQVRAMLVSMLKPAEQSQEALKEIGLSADGLRESIRERGLLVTLQDLTERIGDNDALLARIFPNIRALAGVMDLMGASAEDNARIFGELSENTGEAGEAYRKTEGPARDAARAQQELKNAFIELGDAVRPIFTDILGHVRRGIEAFNGLDDSTKQTIVKVALLAAAFGPLSMAFGGLLRVGGAAVMTMGRVATALGTVTAAAAGSSAALKGVGVSAGGAGAAAGGAGAAAGVGAAGWAALLAVLAPVVTGFRAHRQAAGEAQGAVEQYSQAVLGGRMSLDQVRQALQDTRDQVAFLSDAWIFGEDPALTYARVEREVAGAIDDSRQAVDAQVASLERQGVVLTEGEQSLLNAYVANNQFASALHLLDRVGRESSSSLKNLASSEAHAAEAAADADQRHRGMGAAMGSAGASAQGAGGKTRGLSSDVAAAADAASDADQKFQGFTGSVRSVPPKATTTVSAPGLASTWAGVRGYASTLAGIPSSKTTTIWTKYVTTGAATPGEIGSIRHAGGSMGGMGARRLHGGGTLRGNESMAIIEPRTERVITENQWRALKNARPAVGPAPQRGGGGGTLRLVGPVTLRVGDEEFDGYIRGQAEAVVGNPRVLDSALSGLMRRAG